MTNREKVIEGLRHCTAWAGLHECQPKVGPDCPYEDEADCKLKLMRDALSMIKEQPEIVRCKDCRWYDEKASFCDNCHLPREQTFFCADGKRREYIQ